MNKTFITAFKVYFLLYYIIFKDTFLFNEIDMHNHFNYRISIDVLEKYRIEESYQNAQEKHNVEEKQEKTFEIKEHNFQYHLTI